MSRKLLFEICYDEVEGVSIEEHTDLRLSEEDVDAKILNALAISLGVKVNNMFKSNEVKTIMLDKLIDIIKSNTLSK